MSNFESFIDHELIPWLEQHGLKLVFIVLGAIILNYLLQRVIIKIIRVSVTADRHKSVEAEKKRERTLIRICTWATAMVITIIAAMTFLQEVGLPVGPMLAGAGILGLAVGFGGQYLIRDYITGLLIIFENQYQIGDYVELDSTGGTVEDISLRMTTLRDLDGTVHHVPHGDVKRVANYSKFFSRININVNVSYNENLDNAIAVINRVGNELAATEPWKNEIITPPQFLRVDGFTETSVTLKIVGDTIPNRQWAVGGELRKRLKEAFDREEIHMVVVQRIIHQMGSGDKGIPGA